MSTGFFICGIDGGGTSSKCALSDGFEIIASSKRGSSNVYAVGFESALKNVMDSINDCLSSHSLHDEHLNAIHLSSAGFGDESTRRRFSDELTKAYPNARVGVSDDAYPLLWSSGLDGSGICAIAGTGSIAFGINREGRKVRSGGYGWRLGDEGSAYHIAYEAIRHAVRASEALERTTVLSADVLSYFGFENISEAIYYVNDNSVTKSMIADFAPQVMARAYEDADPVAVSIMEHEIDEFSKYIVSVMERMDGSYDRKIVLSGGLIDRCTEYRTSLISKLCFLCPGWEIYPAEEMAAVKGSLKLALNMISKH